MRKFIPFFAGITIGLYFLLAFKIGEDVTVASYEYNPSQEAQHILSPSNETGFALFGGKKNNQDPKESVSRWTLLSKITDETNLYNSINIKFRDNEYNSISKDHYKIIKRSWEKYLFEKNIQYIFEAFDCDNYSNAFKSFVELYNLTWGCNIAVGKVVVHNKNEFAFIAGEENAFHMLNIIYIDNEFFIVEPQNSISVELSKYPNNQNILEIEI